MTRDEAEAVGLLALGHLASDAERLGQFLSATGLDPAGLRQAAADPALLGAVLDFILQEDRWVLDLAAASGLPPTAVAEARAALPGGQAWHWT
jgi:Protein of unknown function (DUF3572)